MRWYDWLIVVAIGALCWGAYQHIAILPADIDPAYLDRAYADSFYVTFDVLYFLAYLVGLFAIFAIYLIVFRGGASQMKSGAFVLLVVILVSGMMQIGAAWLMFTGWADQSDLSNRVLVYQMMVRITQITQGLAVGVFAILCVAALLRRRQAIG
ncbi:MAG: hypothetical protein AAGF88_05545 [Pseudomonadota bacterium]